MKLIKRKKQTKLSTVNNTGITLIALVVTIVVLLILAGITITAILSEGGILNTTKRTQKAQEEATVREKVQVMLADAKLQNIANKTELVDYLKDEGYEPTENTEEGTVTITDSGYEITIDKNTFQITDIKENGNTEEILAPGLYDSSNVLLASWEELEEMGLNIATDYTGYNKEGTMYYLLANNTEINNGASKLVIKDTITSIGNNTLRKCTSLTSITIPESVTSIGNYAFDGCTGLTSITIPSSVTSVGASAFRECSSLTNITIPESVTSIGTQAFYGCTGLTSITIPSSVTSVGASAFRECSSLINITIPSSVTSIGNYAFDGCTGLINITIPSSVTEILHLMAVQV